MTGRLALEVNNLSTRVNNAESNATDMDGENIIVHASLKITNHLGNTRSNQLTANAGMLIMYHGYRNHKY